MAYARFIMKFITSGFVEAEKKLLEKKRYFGQRNWMTSYELCMANMLVMKINRKVIVVLHE